MKKIILCLLCLLPGSLTLPCTVFQLTGPQPLVAKSFDWWVDHGMALVNLRGLQKTALLIDPKAATPLQWISKYGNLTFNQVSREFPFGGINEKGLVVEILWFDDADYPAIDKNLTAINESQWIQYLLDTASTTDEAIAALTATQVQMGFAPVHYMICDASASCATVEYANKKLTVHSGSGLPFSVLANNSYDDSIDYLKSFLGFGGNKTITVGEGSLDRFVVAVDRVVNTTKANAPVARAFQIMDEVKTNIQAWKITYQNQKVTFNTRKFLNMKEIDLGKLNFSCKTGSAQYFDISQNPATTDVTSLFADLTTAQNRVYLNKSVYLPTNIIKLIDNYTTSSPPCLE